MHFCARAANSRPYDSPPQFQTYFTAPFHSAHALLSIRDTAIQSPEKGGVQRENASDFFLGKRKKKSKPVFEAAKLPQKRVLIPSGELKSFAIAWPYLKMMVAFIFVFATAFP